MSDLPMLPFDEPEEWRPVLNWQGFYEVSSRGRVRSLPRPSGYGAPPAKGLLEPSPRRPKDHLCVTLSRPGEKLTMPVHIMVLEAFAGPRPEGLVGRHGPGGMYDNQWPENLCWGTQAENMDDKNRDGTMVRGAIHTLAALTDEIVAECRRRYATGQTATALAGEFGVSQATMYRAVTGASWGHVAEPPVTDPARPNIRAARDQGPKVSEGDVREIRRRYAEGARPSVLATEFGYSRGIISRIVNRKSWKHVA